MGSVETAELLLQRGANPNLVDTDRVSPLHVACRLNHLEVARCLVEQGKADVRPSLCVAVPHARER